MTIGPHGMTCSPISQTACHEAVHKYEPQPQPQPQEIFQFGPLHVTTSHDMTGSDMTWQDEHPRGTCERIWSNSCVRASTLIQLPAVDAETRDVASTALSHDTTSVDAGAQQRIRHCVGLNRKSY